MIPERIRTGYRETTVPNPANLFSGIDTAETFQGDASKYNFLKQTQNFKVLQSILERNGDGFTKISAAKYKGDLHINHRFDVLTESGKILWHKYVGHAAQSGQNHIFIHGRRLKISVFMKLDPDQQDCLVRNDEFMIGKMFTPAKLQNIDEAGGLWC
jgi:hypothetical protein